MWQRDDYVSPKDMVSFHCSGSGNMEPLRFLSALAHGEVQTSIKNTMAVIVSTLTVSTFHV